MIHDSKDSGLSTTEIVLLVLGVLVFGWFLLGLVRVIVGFAFHLAILAFVIAVIVIGVKFLFGGSSKESKDS